MKNETLVLIANARKVLRNVALAEAKQNPLAAAFLGWLLRLDDFTTLIESAAASAAKAKGGERSSRNVAVLGFACGVESLKTRFSSEFVKQVEWCVGRPNFAPGGEPCGFIADPISFAGVVLGAEGIPESGVHHKCKNWFASVWQDSVNLVQDQTWRGCLLKIIGSRIGITNFNESTSSEPIWLAPAFHNHGWSKPDERSSRDVLNAALLKASSVTDGFEAGMRLAAIEWAASHFDDSISLVLSGGGLRATLFQLGVVAYLAKSGQLDQVGGLVSVSGGSILAGHFAVNWTRAKTSLTEFTGVAGNLVRFARSDIRHQVLIPWLWSRLNPWLWFTKSASRTGRLRAAYALHFAKIRLGDLNNSECPEVAFVATDSIRLERIAFTARTVARFPVDPKGIKSGGLTHTVAESTGVPLALAVAASSCFPPVFPRMKLNHLDFGLHYDEFKDELSLNDGGVIGNLGIEVLLSLNEIEWKATRNVIVVDAQRPQGDKPGNGPLTDLSAQGSALSHAAINSARQQLGSDVTFVRLSERQPEPPGLPFTTQTPLALFRTDLDAPSWQECHALMLHGFAAAAISLGKVDDRVRDKEAGLELVSGILTSAGCPEPLSAPTDADLEASKNIPMRRLLCHAVVLVGIILALLVGVGLAVVKLSLSQAASPIQTLEGLPLNVSDIPFPSPVPQVRKESLREVALLPSIDYRPFYIQTYQSLVDLRQWKPFAEVVNSRTSPVITTRRIVGIKKEPIDYIRMYAATEGAGIYARCISGQRYWVEHATSTGKPAVNIMHEYHLVVDVSSVPVWSRFEVVAQLTTWNGMKEGDPWHAFVAFTDIAELKVQLLFPFDRPFKSRKFVCYPNQQDEEVPLEGKFKQLTSDPRSIYWEIKSAVGNTTYEIQWSW